MGQELLFFKIAYQLYNEMANFRMREGASMKSINQMKRLSLEQQATHDELYYENHSIAWWLEVIGAPSGDCS